MIYKGIYIGKPSFEYMTHSNLLVNIWIGPNPYWNLFLEEFCYDRRNSLSN